MIEAKNKINYFELKKAICISVAVTLGVLLYWIFKIEYGYWIVLTISIIFAFPQKGVILKRTFDRLLGCFLGLILGLLFLDFLTEINQQLIFVLPLMWFLIFYVQLVTGNFWLSSMLTTLFVPIVLSLIFGTIELHTLLVNRIYCTVIGAFIAFCAQIIIFREQPKTAKDIESDMGIIFNDFALIIEELTDCFINDRKLNLELRARLRELFNKINSIEQLYYSLRFELSRKRKDRKEYYSFFFKKVFRVNHYLRKLICIANHDKYDGTYLDKETIKELSYYLSDSFKNYSSQCQVLTTSVETYVKNKISGKKPSAITPTYFFMVNIIKLSRLSDEFRKLFNTV